ncbi:MAG TPA: lytic transglycosylase domain-containing protein [Longimicrobiales bacterium]|nr:lytic transglycosylase domain-containing protein [Longimicrobiales bacterium]
MIDIVRGVLAAPLGRRWPASVLGSGAVALALLMFNAGAPASAAQPAPGAAGSTGEAAVSGEVSRLEERVAQITDGWSGLARYYDTEVAPIERVLLRYRDDPALVERVAVALVREANRVGVEPRLLLAVLLVENPWLDPGIRSSVGAIGLMQVMPLHRGAWQACASDLEDIDANVCHGAQIFAHYFNRSGGNVERALLRYNGCVRGTNTPNCHQYPYHVFARAGKASILAWLDTGAGAAAP